MTTDPDNIQKHFLENLKNHLPVSVSLVDELCEVLEISSTSAYRRLSGETSLTIHEINKLCRKHRISFDSVGNFCTNSVTFFYEIIKDEEGFRKYLRTVKEDLDILFRKKGKVIYAAEDIPLFHNFGMILLAKFKIFYWLKCILNVPSLQGLKFNCNLISDETVEAMQELYDMYVKVSAIEIWTLVTPISLFKQIEFIWESNLFESKEEALAVCDEVKTEFALIERSATLGCKIDSKGNVFQGENNYLLYSSEIEIGNNCILTDVDGNLNVYLAFNTFNKMNTTDQIYCGNIHEWLKNLLSKSNLLSGVSEKKRSQFFKSLNDALENTRRKIEQS
jgi:hypothetical protein